MMQQISFANRFAAIAPAGARMAVAMAALLALGAAPEAPVPAGPAAPAGPTTPAPGRLPAPPASGEVGYVLTEFTYAITPGGKDDCPDGLAGTVRENYVESLPVAERARLLLPANEAELTSKWKASVVGPDSTNICSNPEQFDRPMQRTLKGKVSRGLNLDGDDGDGSGNPQTCAHENFTSPTGERGIDNQVYRAMGCTRNYRGVDGNGGDIVAGFNHRLATGETSMVVLLRKVNSFVDDNDVEVIFGTTDDRPAVDSKLNILPGASFTLSRNPHWRNVMHGRIVHGELITDPVDVRLTQRWGQGGLRGEKTEWIFNRGRLRFAFKPDGSIRGIFGGYQPVLNVTRSTQLGGVGSAVVAGIDCAAEVVTLKKLADGDRDPKTGRCTSISSEMDIAGLPAFVFDRPPATTIASKGS